MESGNPRDQRTGFLNRPPRALLTALQKLKLSHDMDDSCIEESIEQAFQRRPKLQESICYLGRQNDPGSNKAHQSENRDEADPDCPHVHYGIIASGKILIKNSRKRHNNQEWLSRESIYPIRFEMEAAGLMNTFPCLVIRGICDYADERKKDVWKKYAALVAAVYAKDLLCHVDKREIDAGPPLGLKRPRLNTETAVKRMSSPVSSQGAEMNEDEVGGEADRLPRPTQSGPFTAVLTQFDDDPRLDGLNRPASEKQESVQFCEFDTTVGLAFVDQLGPFEATQDYVCCVGSWEGQRE